MRCSAAGRRGGAFFVDAEVVVAHDAFRVAAFAPVALVALSASVATRGARGAAKRAQNGSTGHRC